MEKTSQKLIGGAPMVPTPNLAVDQERLGGGQDKERGQPN
jgi:hypothetical protein